MLGELNEILFYLNKHQNQSPRKRNILALRLNSSIPSKGLNEVIQKLSKDGFIYVYMHNEASRFWAPPFTWEKNISFSLSRKGKEFIESGGYRSMAA